MSDIVVNLLFISGSTKCVKTSLKCVWEDNKENKRFTLSVDNWSCWQSNPGWWPILLLFVLFFYIHYILWKSTLAVLSVCLTYVNPGCSSTSPPRRMLIGWLSLQPAGFQEGLWTDPGLSSELCEINGLLVPLLVSNRSKGFLVTDIFPALCS